MKNNQKGIFCLNSSFFILVSLLILDFGIPVHADQNVKSEELEPQFLKSELDSEPISNFFNRMISKDELKSQNPVKDSVAQLNSSSIEAVLTLLKTIQVELSALRKKTNEENQELKSQIADLRGKIRGQGKEILKGQSQIQEKIESNHNETKKEFANLSTDLKSQMTSLFNSNRIQQSHQQNEIQSPAPDRPHPRSFSSSPALTAPQFFFFENFGGSSFTPSSDEWKTKCEDLSLHDSLSSSLKTGGHCLFVCPEKNCQAEGFGYFKTECQKINPDTKEIGDFKDIGLLRVKSFRQC